MRFCQKTFRKIGNILRMSKTALLILAAAVVASASAETAKGPSLKTLHRVVIGVSPSISSIGIFAAQEKGYFREQGIDGDIRSFPGSTATILPLVSSGRLDVGACGVDAGLFNAIAKDGRVLLVADKGSTPAPPSYKAIIASRKLYSGKLDSMVLKGKRFATPAKGFESEIIIDRFLHRFGLRLEDVEMVSLPYPGINAALASGSIFGAVQIEPFLSSALANGSAVEVMDAGKIYPGQQGGIIVYSRKFAKDDRDFAIRFMTAYLKGTRYFNDYRAGKVDKREFFLILKKYTSIDDPALAENMRYPALNPNGYLNVNGLKDDLHWYHAHAEVETEPAIETAVDHDFVKEALKILGRRP